MKLITPFDLVRMFPEGKTLAIVGNARTLLDTERGALIDSHDVVVRFNECALDEFERYVGARTDILVSNPYPEARIRPILDGRSVKLVLIINPQTRRGDFETFSRWVGSNDVLFTYTPDLVGVADSTHMAGLTTGTYAIHLLSRVLRPRQMFLTGFTMFQDGGPGHYWQSGLPPGVASHDLAQEARLFISVINSSKSSVRVTREIKEVADRVGMTLAKHISIESGEC